MWIVDLGRCGILPHRGNLVICKRVSCVSIIASNLNIEKMIPAIPKIYKLIRKVV